MILLEAWLTLISLHATLASTASGSQLGVVVPGNKSKMMANRREGFRFFYKLIECFDHCPSLPASSEIRASLKSRDYNRLLDKILNYI